MEKLTFLALFSLLILTVSAQKNGYTEQVAFGPTTHIYLMDSTQASHAISTDESDHFFSRITVTEMLIQMKTTKEYATREKLLNDYVEFLKSDVEDFNAEDKTRIKRVFKDIEEMLSSINANLFVKDIELIKTKANHYGNSVYYTRENRIIIPEDVFENFNEENFTQVMLHEIFHILSRYQPELRNKLYDLIGFKPVEGSIEIPEELDQRKLLNPDGTTDYYITLKDVSGNDVLAYPMISSSEERYISSKKSFFEYLEFHLYNLIPRENGDYKLELDENGQTTLGFQKIPGFFQKIKDNTSYIIHPDEIMADNFIYTIYFLAKGKKLKTFSEEGMKLINQVANNIKTL